MRATIKKIILLVPVLLIFAAGTLADQLAYPIKVSKNSRYFVDSNEQPFFWLGTTQLANLQGTHSRRSQIDS